MAGIANRGNELQEERPVALLENALFGADAKDDVLLAAERCPSGHARTPIPANERQAPPRRGWRLRSWAGWCWFWQWTPRTFRGRRVSFVACTSRVATLPRSVQSISCSASWRSSSSNKFHLAAARFRLAMRSRTSAEQPCGTNRLSPSTRNLPAEECRQLSSPRMAKVSAASMEA